MRLRLLMRRLTVSAPHMSVRSALPWPLRWIVLAIVFGFCSALGMWAFELGKEIAGVDRGIKQQLLQAHTETQSLRGQIDLLKTERDKAQSVANTVNTVLTTDKAARDKLAELNQQLTAENQRLKDDLGFFEQLLPATGANTANAGTLAIRSLQAKVLPGGAIKWQVLVTQGVKNPLEFDAQLELVFAGLSNVRPWTGSPAAGALAFKVKQYGRLEGIYQPPAQVLVKSLTVKVLQNQTLRTVQTIKLF